MVSFTFKVNNVDYSGMIERDSYETSLSPVYGETITTMDGIGHTAVLRLRGEVSFKLNPSTSAKTAAFAADLLNAPVEVKYHCLQRNQDVTVQMVLDGVSAQFLSRCLYGGASWNQLESITLKEL